MPPRGCTRPARITIVSEQHNGLLSRRQILGAAVTVPLWRAVSHFPIAQGRGAIQDVGVVQAARGFVVGTGDTDVSKVELSRDWSGQICRSRVVNRGARPVALQEVVLFDLALDFPASTALYGESFQMLSQSGGTLGAPTDLGSYTDAKHYKMPMPAGAQTYVGAITLSPPEARADGGRTYGAGFTSTPRFAGLFRHRPPSSIQIVVDTEGLSLAPGETWQLEDLTILWGPSRDAVLGTIGDRLSANHPRLKFTAPPTGWCSWYCFGPRG